MSGISRRALTGATALMWPIAVAAGHMGQPDAELLQCCATALEADRRSAAIMDSVYEVPLSDPCWEAAFVESDGIMERYHAAVRRAEQIPARTEAGLRAKAALVLSYLWEDVNESAIALSLARDLLGSGAPRVKGQA